MNVLLLMLVIGLAALAGVERFLNYRLEHDVTEAQTIRRKKLKSVLAWIALIAAVIGVMIAVISFQNSETEKRGASEIQSNLLQQVQSLTADNKQLRSDVTGLRKTVGDLMLAMANNPALDLATRSTILQAKRKFEITDTNVGDLAALVSGWSNTLTQAQIEREKRRLKTVEEQKQFLTPRLPLWEYTIRTFQAMLAAYTQPNDPIVSSDCVLPTLDSLCRGFSEATGYGATQFDVCEISLRTNSVWNCRCSIQIPDRMKSDSGGSTGLKIECKGKNGSELLWVHGDHNELVATIVARNAPPITTRYPIEDYEKGVHAALRDFIGAQADEFGPTDR